MKPERIREICIKEGMSESMIDGFTRFFSKRFPNEDDRVYSCCAEWARRFMTGNPEAYMDEESLRIYVETIGG